MKLIDKDAALAEIERLQRMLNIDNPLGMGGMIELQVLKDKLDTLEVKEVDIENTAITEWNDYIKKINGEPDYAYMLIKREDYIALAEHFFELGLRTQKGEEV